MSIGDCINCGHPIGYHHQWRSTPEEMFCTVKDCHCPGYRDDNLTSPQTGPLDRDDVAELR